MNSMGKRTYSELNQFKAFLEIKKKENSTVKMYITVVGYFLNWLQSQNMSLSSVRQEDIQAFCHQLHRHGAKYSTTNKSISILSSFYKWAKSQGYVETNPAEHLRMLEPKKAEKPKWLSAEETERLLQIAAKERNVFKKTRNEALIYVMLFAGLRVEEVSELKLDSVRDEGLIVYEDDVESRKVPIEDELNAKLQAWLKVRYEMNKPEYEESPFLFVTERSPRMQPRAIQFVIESYSDKLGFPVLCQHLRHTFCYRQVMKGTSAKALQELAGHKSLLTTLRYYAGSEE